MLPNKHHPFKLIAQALPDEKKRINIAQSVSKNNVLYDIYINDLEQIMLDPVATIPDYELALLKNKKVMASIQKGLKEAAEGKTQYLGSFTKIKKTLNKKPYTHALANPKPTPESPNAY